MTRMEHDRQLRYNRDLLNKEQPLGSFTVTEEAILRFAECTGETSPLFTDNEGAEASELGGLIAPPTFCNLFISAAERPDIELEFGDTGFFAGQAIDCLGVVRPGDVLSATTALRDVYSKTGRSGTMVFAVWETTFTNQRGEAVSAVRESFVRTNRRG